MFKKYANYVLAALFLLIALRDWFFPGRLQMHPGKGSPWFWSFMTCLTLFQAIRENRKANRISPST